MTNIDLENMPQKKLKKISKISNIIYGVLAFLAPIITVTACFYSNGDIDQRWRIPFMMIIICVAIVITALKFMKDRIEKIKILNIDGTYNKKAQTFKHVMLAICKAAIPLVLLIVTVLFTSALKDMIDFYAKIVIICLSFFIASILLENLWIKKIDEELEIREKIAEKNAVERRVSNLSNINK